MGFDEFYWFETGVLIKTDLRKEENEKKLLKAESLNLLDRFEGQGAWSDEEMDDGTDKKKKKKKGNSLDSILKRVSKSSNKKALKAPKKLIPKQIKFINKN